MAHVRLGYLEPFKPFCWSEAGTMRGRFVAALTASVPSDTTLEWVGGQLDALPTWLAESRIDAIAAKAITAERATAFTFSDPLLQTAAALFGVPGSAAPHPSEAGDAIIATPANGPLAALVARLAPRAQVLRVEDYPAAVTAVETGAAHWAALNADAVGALFPGRTGAPGPRFAPFGLGVAVAVNDPSRVLARLGLTRR